MSLEKAKRYVASLEERCGRMPELLGFRSQDICTAYKQLLQTAASLAVVCMQTGDLQSAWTMVRKAEKGEAGIQRFGLASDREWSGQIPLCIVQGFLLFK